MNVFEKIKLWFTSISKVVNFLVNTYKDAEILADKKANFKTWADFVIAFIKDALQYADDISKLAQGTTIQTKGQVVSSVPSNPVLGEYKTMYFQNKAKNLKK